MVKTYPRAFKRLPLLNLKT